MDCIWHDLRCSLNDPAAVVRLNAASSDPGRTRRLAAAGSESIPRNRRGAGFVRRRRKLARGKCQSFRRSWPFATCHLASPPPAARRCRRPRGSSSAATTQPTRYSGPDVAAGQGGREALQRVGGDGRPVGAAAMPSTRRSTYAGVCHRASCDHRRDARAPAAHRAAPPPSDPEAAVVRLRAAARPRVGRVAPGVRHHRLTGRRPRARPYKFPRIALG